jgi:putative ATP-dependent endonuclease of the OLD family
MAEVETGLLTDLNKIYLGDTHFDRIICRRDTNGLWEIFLAEQGGVPVRLSESGSSLKSIFIILATIRLNPIVAQESSLENNIFCVEEPENNLHPSLLRRLLDFLGEARDQSNSALLITTHSSAAIDWASRRDDSSTYHVRRMSDGVVIQETREYTGLRSLLEDLDIRASEILQANGVIWVEGPSDRIYLKRWLDIHSSGELQEGVHYSIMFYGGKLLSHLSALPPPEAKEAISLLQLNRNLILIIDSDRRKLKSGRFRADLNQTKRRLIDECQKMKGRVWVTKGKEVENYLSLRILSAISNRKYQKADEYDSVPDQFSGSLSDKITLAHTAMDICQQADLDVLDLKTRLSEVQADIMRWNSLG